MLLFPSLAFLAIGSGVVSLGFTGLGLPCVNWTRFCVTRLGAIDEGPISRRLDIRLMKASRCDVSM